MDPVRRALTSAHGGFRAGLADDGGRTCHSGDTPMPRIAGVPNAGPGVENRRTLPGDQSRHGRDLSGRRGVEPHVQRVVHVFAGHARNRGGAGALDRGAESNGPPRQPTTPLGAGLNRLDPMSAPAAQFRSPEGGANAQTAVLRRTYGVAIRDLINAPSFTHLRHRERGSGRPNGTQARIRRGRGSLVPTVVSTFRQGTREVTLRSRILVPHGPSPEQAREDGVPLGD